MHCKPCDFGHLDQRAYLFDWLACHPSIADQQLGVMQQQRLVAIPHSPAAAAASYTAAANVSTHFCNCQVTAAMAAAVVAVGRGPWLHPRWTRKAYSRRCPWECWRHQLQLPATRCGRLRNAAAGPLESRQVLMQCRCSGWVQARLPSQVPKRLPRNTAALCCCFQRCWDPSTFACCSTGQLGAWGRPCGTLRLHSTGLCLGGSSAGQSWCHATGVPAAPWCPAARRRCSD